MNYEQSISFFAPFLEALQQHVHSQARFDLISELDGKPVIIWHFPSYKQFRHEDTPLFRLSPSDVGFTLLELARYTDVYNRAYKHKPDIGEALRHATATVSFLDVVTSVQPAAAPSAQAADIDISVNIKMKTAK